MQQVTKPQIKHIASLAKLHLSDAEVDKYEVEFNAILNYVSKIDECDVSGIEFEHNLQDFKGKVLNEDVVQTSKISKEKMLQNATEGRNKNGYVRVSKIVNK